MMFGGSSWSELPLCSLVVLTSNGDELTFTFAIDTELGVIGTIDQLFQSTATVDRTLPISGIIDQIDSFTLILDSSKEQTLI
tara:strand:+ start:38 stop:283 length:246 start_codon:yes stop_codon:yes gene_type:complete